MWQTCKFICTVLSHAQTFQLFYFLSCICFFSESPQHAGKKGENLTFILPGFGIIVGFPGGSVVKNLPAGAQDTRVQSPSRGRSREEGMATHTSILGWEILWREKPGGLQLMGSQRIRHNWETKLYITEASNLRRLSGDSVSFEKMLPFVCFSRSHWLFFLNDVSVCQESCAELRLEGRAVQACLWMRDDGCRVCSCI